ncbi:MAG: hypothetical protein CL663_08925 [Bacteroidetes bacterium]|nr:hypothetical protein [Bacteroidota bacterium]|tara:strand:- start:1637 stop:2017 length:381 start_codon:yes stop_codon:yes gene_type:complete
MESRKYLKLNQIDCYKTSFRLSNKVWSFVKEWGYLEKDTIGKQFIRAVDSISANIAEGFGRYNKKDKIRFYQISKGSLSEFKDWLMKAKVRGLLNDEQYNELFILIKKIPLEINQLIKFTNMSLKD